MNSRTDLYGELLLKSLPAVIESDSENERMIAEVEALQGRERKLLPEERRLLSLLLLLIEDYEEGKYRLKAATPDEILRELMRARGMRQKDLLGVFGSKGIASEVVRGRRAISRTQAKRLARFFHISPALIPVMNIYLYKSAIWWLIISHDLAKYSPQTGRCVG